MPAIACGLSDWMIRARRPPTSRTGFECTRQLIESGPKSPQSSGPAGTGKARERVPGFSTLSAGLWASSLATSCSSTDLLPLSKDGSRNYASQRTRASAFFALLGGCKDYLAQITELCGLNL